MTDKADPKPSGNRGAAAREVILSVIAPKSSIWNSVLVVVLAFVTALVVSAVFIAVSDANVIQAPDLLTALNIAWQDVSGAYGGLLTGALGNPSTIIAKLTSGDPKTAASAFYPLSEPVVAAAPLVFTGLAVALGFRA